MPGDTLSQLCSEWSAIKILGQRAISVVKGAGNAYGRPGDCSGAAKVHPNQHPSREAKKLSNFSLFLGCALPCYRNCFPCYFLSVNGQEIPKNRPGQGATHGFPSGNRDFPVFFPV